MKVETSLVDIDSIEFKPDIYSFDADLVLLLANSISQIGGLAQIPLVMKVGLDDYILKSHFFEYYSYLHARTINPDLADRVRVIVTDSKTIRSFEEQLTILIKARSKQSAGEIVRENENTDSDFSVNLQNLTYEIKALQETVQRNNLDGIKTISSLIESKLPKVLPPIEAFNQINQPEISILVNRNLSFIQKHRKQKFIKALQDFRESHPERDFKSFHDVLSIIPKGCISKEKMIDIIDNWH